MEAGTKREKKFPNFVFRDLQLGDVILSRDPSGTNSKVIRGGLLSEFSHAAIYYSSQSILEAVGSGVRHVNLGNCGVVDKNNVCVLRLKNDDPDFEAVAKKAASAASRYKGRNYWTKGALMSVLGNSKDDHLGRMFCSQLVAKAYAAAGKTIAKNRHENAVTPKTLLKSNLFRPVTKEVVVPITGNQNYSDFRTLDHGHFKAGGDTYADLEFKVLKDFWDVSKRLNLPFSPSFKQALFWLEFSTAGRGRDQLDVLYSDIMYRHNYREKSREGLRSVSERIKSISEVENASKNWTRSFIKDASFLLPEWKREILIIDFEFFAATNARHSRGMTRSYEMYLRYQQSRKECAQSSINAVQEILNKIKPLIQSQLDS